ncbi:MAG: hypothetical protein IPO43_17455 [Rhodoferax sp.]|nr:hypothetical protein [Rhodoferax sp.]
MRQHQRRHRLDDAGPWEAFAPRYEDWGACEVLYLSGTDPFETKSTLFTSWIMGGAQRDKRLIFATPHRTMGVAGAEQRGGLWLPVISAPTPCCTTPSLA